MYDDNNDISDLLYKKIREEKLTAGEAEQFNTWYNASDNNRRLFAELTDKELLLDEYQVYRGIDVDAGYAEFEQKYMVKKTGMFTPLNLFLSGAAVLVFVAGFFVFRYYMAQPNRSEVKTPARQQPAQLARKDLFDTVSTKPKLRRQVTLPDGTKVWLNVASSIVYPGSFKGKERIIQLAGEGYFEVTKDTARPFIVKINNNTGLKVTGTHFNFKFYSNDSSVTATLLEGGIKVFRGNDTAALVKPGKEASIDLTSNQPIKISLNPGIVDTEDLKKGKYWLYNQPLRIIMNQMERLFDVKIDYSKINADRVVSRALLDANGTFETSLNLLAGTNEIHYDRHDNLVTLYPGQKSAN